ncbi:acyl carrier protein [Pseudomonas sp. zfem002]|uniref:acyl carrier protein n=1 Tax=Pseudomonas sp. zfem002 TaxID=3078197 RepID=UPI002929E146|nr:phosphopantetheine-binding protein [Pseudomonas sp. zfem002]MDU9391347.1 phosphopantetheine-binding protein [Pseudomonas sp. zfem002]
MADPHSEMVVRCIVERLGLKRPPPVETRLIDLEMDSLDIVELVVDIEKELNVLIPEEDVVEEITVGQLIATVKNHASDSAQ